ncbi:MAG: thioredoxin family protein [Erysipelotrichaceae bacterium]|nr:thioredoxin family protein [Erysipelotrichaceae bacterium]
MERNSRIIRIILSISIIFTLLSCTTQQGSTNTNSSSSTSTTAITTTITTPVVTTTTKPVTTTPVTTTTPITTTTTPVTTTTPIVTTIVEETGSMLAPVTSNYLISSIEEGYSFYAILGTTQCPHCKAQKTLLEDYLSTRPNITFFVVMLDTDTSTRKAELVEYLDLYSIPLTIKVENGEVVNKFEGRMELEELERFMQ